MSQEAYEIKEGDTVRVSAHERKHVLAWQGGNYVPEVVAVEGITDGFVVSPDGATFRASECELVEAGDSV